MKPQDYDYYSDRLTAEERMEYTRLVTSKSRRIISEPLFNTMQDFFWLSVKERVDRQEDKDKEMERKD